MTGLARIGLNAPGRVGFPGALIFYFLAFPGDELNLWPIPYRSGCTPRSP